MLNCPSNLEYFATYSAKRLEKAYNIFGVVDMNYCNNSMYDFVQGNVNYKAIIQSHIDRAEKKKEQMKKFIAAK